MKQSLLIAFFLCVTISYVNGHARMMQPASRGSAYRRYPDKFPKTNQDDSRHCQTKSNPDNSTCGICGPIYNGDVTSSSRVKLPLFKYDFVHYSFEKGGPYYTGKIVETYKKGQTIEVLIEVGVKVKI
jgi:hypothetical protein